MSYILFISRFICISAPVCLAGCGTYVPHIAEITDVAEGIISADGVLERNIKEKIYCEIRRAVYAAGSSANPVRIYRDSKPPETLLPVDWGVQLTLTLTVDENTSLNPGLTLNDPLPAAVTRFPNAPSVITSQIFNLGFGGNVTSAATRIDKFTSYYNVGLLRKTPIQGDPCYAAPLRPSENSRARGSSYLIESDLRVEQWLREALLVSQTYRSTFNPGQSFKQDAMSYNVKFIVTTNGNISPSWRLVRVSTNLGGPLLSGSRIRTHELLITFGPESKQRGLKGPTNEPGLLAANDHLALQIGSSVANSLRSLSGQ